eukprot:2707698-Pyramimonas_sp.AAC.2
MGAQSGARTHDEKHRRRPCASARRVWGSRGGSHPPAAPSAPAGRRTVREAPPRSGQTHAPPPP